MLPVGGADDMRSLLLQLSLDKTLFPGANKLSVFWLTKITLENSLGAAATVTPAWTGLWLTLNLGPA